MKLTKRQLREIIREEIKNSLNEKIKPKFKKGQKVTMTDDALDNYGAKYKNKVFTITNVATSEDDHPGFDAGLGSALYDLQGLNFSLYDWELQGK